MTRAEILESASTITCQGREEEYGSPENNFGTIAQYWSTYTGALITAEDVACMMALLKIARIQSGKTKDDNYIDLAGYAACAGEIASVCSRKEIG